MTTCCQHASSACCDAGEGLLANIGAGEFLQLYEDQLPSTMTGQDFIAQFGDNYDTVTQVRLQPHLLPWQPHLLPWQLAQH